MAEAHQLFSLSSDEKRLKHDNNSQSCSAWIHSDSGFFFFSILFSSSPTQTLGPLLVSLLIPRLQMVVKLTFESSNGFFRIKKKSQLRRECNTDFMFCRENRERILLEITMHLTALALILVVTGIAKGK